MKKIFRINEKYFFYVSMKFFFTYQWKIIIIFLLTDENFLLHINKKIIIIFCISMKKYF